MDDVVDEVRVDRIAFGREEQDVVGASLTEL